MLQESFLYHLRRISRIKKFLTRSAVNSWSVHLCCKLLILARLPFCRLDKLRKVMNAAACLILDRRRMDSATEALIAPPLASSKISDRVQDCSLSLPLSHRLCSSLSKQPRLNHYLKLLHSYIKPTISEDTENQEILW